MANIAVFVGSLQKKSFNKMLAKNLEQLAPSGTTFEHIDVELPLYNQDLEADFPVKVQKMKDIVRAADGVLFVTPEYNRSIPGVLKNAIDWISRPYGMSAFNGKPGGVVSAGVNHVSGAIAQADLRHIAAFLNMKMMTQPELHIPNAHTQFDEEGNLAEENKRRAAEYITALATWVDKEKE